MTTTERRVLELAILGLETERGRIDEELVALRRRLSTTRTRVSAFAAGPKVSPNKGKRMSAAQKRKISLAMKAKWAANKRGIKAA